MLQACGLATPATLLKYAAICGVGPSLNILKTSPSLVQYGFGCRV